MEEMVRMAILPGMDQGEVELAALVMAMAMVVAAGQGEVDVLAK